jgi:hypothetical protein
MFRFIIIWLGVGATWQLFIWLACPAIVQAGLAAAANKQASKQRSEKDYSSFWQTYDLVIGTLFIFLIWPVLIGLTLWNALPWSNRRGRGDR